MQEVVCTLTAAIKIKSHPTDNTKVVLNVSGTDYNLDATDVLQAVHNCINT